MSPEYLKELADVADPDKLWRLSGIGQRELPPEKRRQIDMGVALRRHAAHIEELQRVLAEGKSLLITPLSPNGSARKTIETPADHQKLRKRWL